MNKWYQTITVNHKEEEGKLSHWLDDENYKILCEERVEQLNEIEKLHNIIKEVREYIEEHTTYERYGYIDELRLIDLDFSIKDLKQILDKENDK